MFQPSSFKNFKGKSNKAINDAAKSKAEELHFEVLTIEILNYWNSKKIKVHRVDRSKILSRLNEIVKGGIKTAPSLFQMDVVKDVIDKYDKHLKTGFSKLSVGEGRLFKFSVDEFFKFSKFQKEKIENNKRFEILKGKRSLFYSLHKNENEFFYPQKDARVEFREMYSAIVGHFKNYGISENEIDGDLKKYSQLNLQKFFDNNKGKMVLCDYLVSDYELRNNELFYTPELYFLWLMRFIEDKKKSFKIEHLNAKFFYSNFYKWMTEIGRVV